MKTLLGLCIGLSVALTGFAQDFKSNTNGFSLSASGSYASWSSESAFMGTLDDSEPTGLGLSLKAAYGFNQNIEAFLAYSTWGFQQEFDWDAYRKSILYVGGRFNFGATLRQFRPFLEAGLVWNSLTIDPITFDLVNLFKLEANGLGGAFGGGVHFFIIPNLSATAHGRYAFGNFSEILLSSNSVTGLNENVDYGVLAIDLGLTYFFD